MIPAGPLDAHNLPVIPMQTDPNDPVFPIVAGGEDGETETEIAFQPDPGRIRRFAIGATVFDVPPASPGLHVVATPIGNLGDITLRALETLAGVDLIACEDTRVTRVLLDRYAIRARTLSYHEHNGDRQRPRILAALAAGLSVALVSDAGTPLVSDPGFRLVRAVTEAGLAVVPLPGASALLAALVASGLPSDTVLFAGFLPQKGGPRRARLKELATIPATLVLYESPHRLDDSLADMAAELGGERPAAVARELTKRFETVARGTLTELAARFAGAPPKGEIVVVIGPPLVIETAPEDADSLLRAALRVQSPSAAAGDVSRATGLNRRELYRRALELKQEDEGEAG